MATSCFLFPYFNFVVYCITILDNFKKHTWSFFFLYILRQKT